MELILMTWEYIKTHPEEFSKDVFRHMELVFYPMLAAILIAVPLGILITRIRKLEGPIMGFANIVQTIPPMAMLAFMIVIGFGVGKKPAMIALFLYALLPILRNTYTGISGVDHAIKKAARGMGLTNFQLLYMVELPLAFPVIMAGVRTTLVIVIGSATLAALVGGGGLGNLIMEGIGLVRDELILAGAVPAALMALLADVFMNYFQNWATPKGLK